MPTTVASSGFPNKPKLLDRVRDTIRFKHYSLRTEQVYVDWIKRFILFQGNLTAKKWRRGGVRLFE
jgi:hypothetical protein